MWFLMNRIQRPTASTTERVQKTFSRGDAEPRRNEESNGPELKFPVTRGPHKGREFTLTPKRESAEKKAKQRDPGEVYAQFPWTSVRTSPLGLLSAFLSASRVPVWKSSTRPSSKPVTWFAQPSLQTQPPGPSRRSALCFSLRGSASPRGNLLCF